MSTTCRPCLSLDCNFPNDLDMYSLDGLQFFLGNQLFFVFDCPPGFDCQIKPLPWDMRITCCGKTIVGNVPGGSSFAQIQAVYQAMLSYCEGLSCGATNPTTWELRLRCCNTWLVATLPATATHVQRENAMISLLNQCQQITPTCNNIPSRPPPIRPSSVIKLGSIDPIMCLGALSSNAFTAIASFSPLTFAVTAGALPPGTILFQIEPKAATVAGTPTTIGIYNFTIQASDGSNTASRNYQIVVWGISNGTSLPDAPSGIEYNTIVGSQLTAIGGTAPYTFSVDMAAMPAWISSVDVNGQINGIPGPGDVGIVFNFDATVTDSSGKSCTEACSIEVVNACVADVGIVPPLAQPSFLSADLTIPAWASEKGGLVVPGADPPGIQPEWGGTLPVLDYVTIPGTAFYMPTGGFLSDFALNGMLGVVGSITLSQGGGFGPWVLDMWVMVGGVPTQAWTGQKNVGSCGAGTYMRTGGASAGPACFHVSGCPTTIAWWSMDTLPISKLSPDSITGRLFDFSTGAGLFATSVAGQVGNAVRVNSFGVGSRYGIYQSADLSFGSVGFSIVCWVRVTYNVSSPGNNLVNLEYAFYVGGVQHIIAIVEVEGANWVVTLDAAPIGGVTKGFAAGWHFLALTYDAATGAVQFDIDQSGVSAGAVAAMVSESNPLSDLVLRVQTGVIGNTDGDFDEFALFDRVLTQEQLNWIYNAGAGKTWPI